ADEDDDADGRDEEDERRQLKREDVRSEQFIAEKLNAAKAVRDRPGAGAFTEPDGERERGEQQHAEPGAERFLAPERGLAQLLRLSAYGEQRHDEQKQYHDRAG